jgi:hypothetical protein
LRSRGVVGCDSLLADLIDWRSAMGAAVSLREDFGVAELRRLAAKAKDGG